MRTVFRALPGYHPDSIEIGAGGVRLVLQLGAFMGVLAVLLSLGPSVRATGVPPRTVWLALGSYFACMMFNDLVLHPAARRSYRAFLVQLVVLFLYNEFFSLLLVVLPNDPWSGWWIAPALWAFFSGSWQEIEPTWFALGCHVVGPLLTIPVFLHRGAPAAASVAGPMVASLICGASYRQMAALTGHWRETRDRQRAQIEALQARERERVARDLHDSLGSTLSLTSAYADMIHERAEDPVAIRALAGTLRQIGREGSTELRDLLDALAPADATFGALIAVAERLSERCEFGWGLAVTLHSEGDPALPLPSRCHFAATAVLREALHNAARHAGAREVRVTIVCTPSHVQLDVRDDGCGGAGEGSPTGRGLPGMRRRAEELAGTCRIDSPRGGGTHLTWSAPLVPVVRA